MSNGNFAGGDGSVTNPYLIEDALDLNAVRNNLTKSYKLIKDIDLNISPYNTGTGWTPIGDSTNNFTGVFDGNGYIVKNLFINFLMSYVGLFGFISNAIIKNIRLENVNINAAGTLGGLVGYAQNSSSISNSSSTGVIIGNGNKIGGLVGSTYSNVIISNSYSMCSTTGGSSIGGLVGYNNYSSSIFNSYSTGIVNGTNKVGGLIGENCNSTVTNSYWDEETSGQSVSAGGTGLTTAQMKTASSFVNWNTQLLDDGVTHIWVLKDGEYPKLWFEKPPAKYLIKQNNIIYTYDGVTKYLIKQNNIIYTYDGVTITESPSQTLDSNNFNNNGFNDPTIITEEVWDTIFPDKTGLQLLMYTDDTTKTEATITYNVDEYRPIDKLQDQFQIKKYIPN